MFSLFNLQSAICNLQSIGGPSIDRIEPPGWWVQSVINPVRILISGRNLSGAAVSVNDASIQVGPVQVYGEGAYLFTSFRLDSGVAPKPVQVTITTPKGAATIGFNIEPSLSGEGNFQGFNTDDVIYLIMPDRFANGDRTNDDPPISPGLTNRAQARAYHGGDLQGIIDKLDYLKDLGVTAIWTTPIYDNDNHRPESYHGYGAVDFYQVEEHFGTLEKYRELVRRAHARGLKVIQDQVANHTGPAHPWLARPPMPDWFHGTVARHMANNFDIAAVTSPYAAPSARRRPLDGWFADRLPDLNQENPEVTRYLIQNSLWWVGKSGLDGIRLDTVPYVSRSFWKEWSRAMRRQYPRLSVVGEVFHKDPAVVSFFQGGVARFDGIDSGLHTLFDFPLMSALREVFAGSKPMSALADVLNKDSLYPNAAELVTFLGNHDVPRFLTAAQQDVESLKLATLFLLTMRGIPQLYYGDEIGMLGNGDPDNRRDFPGGFPGDSANAFERGGRTPPQAELFDYHRRLLRLRKDHAALRRGTLTLAAATAGQTAFVRADRQERILVVLNNETNAARLTLSIADLGGTASSLTTLFGSAVKAELKGQVVSLEIGPRQGAVLAIVPP